MATCSNCGSRVYGGLCVNCDELATIQRDFAEEISALALDDFAGCVGPDLKLED